VEPSEVANAGDGSFVVRRIKTGKLGRLTSIKTWCGHLNNAAERAFKEGFVQAVHLTADTSKLDLPEKMAFRRKRADISSN